MSTNYEESIKKYILDKDYSIPLEHFFEGLEEKDKYLCGFIFGSEPGKSRFNETLLEIYAATKDKKNKIPDSFYDSMIEHIEQNKNSKVFYNDGYKINTSSINTVVLIEAIQCKDGLKVIPLLDAGNFSESELLNVCSSVLTDNELLNADIITRLRPKIAMHGVDTDEFLLYSYFAEKYKKHKPKPEVLENILKKINPSIRLSDFEELKKSVPRFGYGYKTELLCSQLVKLAEINRVEDFKMELDSELTSKSKINKKNKI